MSGSVSVEGSGGRGRPLSGAGGAGGTGGALWSLLSWLRRDDRSSSSDSLSSAGSDRTAASFAFLPPTPLQQHPADPPPLGPPTDSYRKRVHDGNLRRLRERDLTLHRKYGLYCGYDAFSLPPARKHLSVIESEQDRERRANSESFPRRSAHVPGKRRAPLPPPPSRPSRPHSLVSTASLTRRHIRKRPAPQPPATASGKSKENIEKSGSEKNDITVQMRANSPRDRRPLSNVTSNECNSDKNSKKDTEVKETKIQKEKSFLRQIFENKKRNSTIETAPERILPSISELDKQAAEIIKSCKLTPIEQNNNLSGTMNINETWFCTRCLRRYNSTVVTCEYCLPEQKRLRTLNNARENPSASSRDTNSTQTEKNIATNRISGIGADEKQKLKEMLKEMKDSIPKKSKQSRNDKGETETVLTKKSHEDKDANKTVFTFDSTVRNASLETPTLRVESKNKREMNGSVSEPQPSTSKPDSGGISRNITEIKSIEKLLPKIKSVPVTENVVITQHVVLVAPQQKENPKLDVTKASMSFESTSRVDPTAVKKDLRENDADKSVTKVEQSNLHTPLKISSLLNPVYIPKNNAIEEHSPRNMFFSQNKPITSVLNSTPNPTKDASAKTSVGTSTSKCNQETKTCEITKPKIPTVETKAVIADLLTAKKETTEENSKSKQILPSTSASTNANASSDKSKVIHNMTKFTVDQHSRRRDLINQLEQSIAKGDERAAAEAAVKLAQLRLSCSVLSFSSQIMSQAVGATQEPTTAKNRIDAVPVAEKKALFKINAEVQSSAAISSNSLIKNRPDTRKESPAVQPETSSTEAQTNQATRLINKHDQQQKLPQDDKNPLTAPSTSRQSSNENGSNLTTIQVWVEDREATRGPVRLRISRQAVMGDLRRQAETSLGLVGALQRWIVGRALCTDDRTPLVSLAGPDLSAPFYLCVVETGNTATDLTNIIGIVANIAPDQINADKTSDVYSELVRLEQRALVVNTEPFECGICMEECAVGDGAVLRECVHTFCRACMSDLVKHCEEPIVGCPAMACPGVLQEREIRALVTPEEYERWLARGLAAAESGTRNAFHCRTRDCTGWALCDPGVRRFPCPVCNHNNCIPCQAIHEGETCEQYRQKLQEAATSSSNPSQTDEGTRALLDTLITKGEALECPECKAIITKKWGCDWVKCSACKTEICWVTRGRRWGPGGKGDTTAGCRCGVDGKRCHPSCGYCH
ncbi:hypothetical protein O0L34_g1390 [Tuta absoluta]|nr:hypothetical protein O0L34_g1390 [Tuta absoluta]